MQLFSELRRILTGFFRIFWKFRRPYGAGVPSVGLRSSSPLPRSFAELQIATAVEAASTDRVTPSLAPDALIEAGVDSISSEPENAQQVGENSDIVAQLESGEPRVTAVERVRFPAEADRESDPNLGSDEQAADDSEASGIRIGDGGQLTGETLIGPTVLDEFTPIPSGPGVEASLEADNSFEPLSELDAELSSIFEEAQVEAEEGSSSQGATAPRPRASRPERQPESVAEYTAIAEALAPIPGDYRTWNRALAEHLLQGTSAGSEVYLTVTPRILAHALAEVQGAAFDPEQAQTHFTSAVSALYRDRVLTQRGRLRVLRRYGDDGLPECIGFLALSVLAAYRMRSDEDAAGHAYYVRLADLLECDLVGAYPVGFDPLVFESLWYFLRDWLAEQRGCRLVVPVGDVGLRRFVALPLAHVPLRCLDIEKLPDFFGWAGYQPSGEVTAERIAVDFARWLRARGMLTQTGVMAFSDARRTAVLAQVAAELHSWDGTFDESVSRRSAPVEILFDPVQHRPELFYVPRRPLGFPARFDDGMHAFEASDDGWYGRTSITPQDGGGLANGFIWQTQSAGVEFALRRAGASVISLVPSDDYSYSGFMSARGLRRGVRCAVFCQDDVAPVAAEYLSHVTENPCAPIQQQDLPGGWSLFAGILARRLADAPTGLESIGVQANVGLIPSGGIRLGNRWTWLQGAAPRILVTGLEPGLPVTVDGQPATVGDDGMLQSREFLTGVGAHVIQVGQLRRTVEIVQPSLKVDSSILYPQQPRSQAPVMLALPAGTWTVIGAVPGQVARQKYAHARGTIVECTFVPAWAIQVGLGRGAFAVNVFAGVPPVPDACRRRSVAALLRPDVLAWTTAIYDAAIRRARINSLMQGCDSVVVNESWKAYARCASEIKRTIRRACR
jgi:hypothetical protein